jgi:hypothetical protein
MILVFTNCNHFNFYSKKQSYNKLRNKKKLFLLKQAIFLK